MANGIKIGEVSSNSAIIWTRLTKNPERNVNGIPFPINHQLKPHKFDDLARMEGSVPGATGQVRIAYWSESEAAEQKFSEWHSVDADKDFTCQTEIKGLIPATRYSILAEGRSHGSKVIDLKLAFYRVEIFVVRFWRSRCRQQSCAFF